VTTLAVPTWKLDLVDLWETSFVLVHREAILDSFPLKSKTYFIQKPEQNSEVVQSLVVIQPLTANVNLKRELFNRLDKARLFF
jgi:hypothetical protein